MTEVRIPKLGMSAVEVDILEVLVEPGQRVAIGDPIAEVESEKVTHVIEAEVAGVVSEVLVAAGDESEVGNVLCLIDESQ